MMTIFKNDPSLEKFRARFSGYYKLEPITDTVRQMTYPEVNALQNAGMAYNGRKAFSGGHLCSPLKFSTFQSALNAYLDFIKEHPNSDVNGAVLAEFHNNNTQNILSNATAYPHRKRIYYVVVVQQWKDESVDEDCLKYIKHVANLFRQDYLPNTISLHFHGPNLVMKDGDVILKDYEDPKEVFGDNLKRLKEIKAKYDPTIFFDKGIVIRP
jgi:hypothetical protein